MRARAWRDQCRPLAGRGGAGYEKGRNSTGAGGMGDLPGIVINGASGRMGRMLARVVSESGRARLVGALERPGHDWVGQDLGRAMGEAEMGVTVSDDPLDLVSRAHAVIDFTAPAASVEMAVLTAQARVVHVIGRASCRERVC